MAKRSPLEAAEAARQIGAAAAEHGVDGEASRDREVGARAAHGAPDVVAAAGRREHRPVVRKAALELRAAHRHQAVLLELQLRADDGDLERRLVGRVADERVGEREGERIHRPAGTQADVLQAVAAGVLRGGPPPRTQDLDAHRLPRSFRNSALSIARKRTRSPEANRLGSWRSGSNTASGVRPMTFQPPEMAYG